jgi:hypothetical protein
MNYKEPNNQQSNELKDSGMKMMMVMMIACCAIPLGIIFFTGGGLGWWLGRSNQPSNTQPTNQPSNPPKPQN